MDGRSIMLYVALVFLIVGSAYFPLVEAAFVNANTIRIKNRAENRDARAKKALYVLDNFDKALSTILLGTNVTSILAAALVTLVVTRRLGSDLVVWSTMAFTGFSFLFTEMIPKTYARDKAESVALALAGSFVLVMRISAPLVAVFAGVERLADHLTGGETTPSVTEDELYELFETIAEEGTLAQGRAGLSIRPWPLMTLRRRRS